MGILCLCLGAQDAPPEDHQQIGIKFYPSFLMDVSGPSLEGGIEYRFNPIWSVQQDFGYISTWDERYFLAVDDMEGLRFRTMIRKYRGPDGGYHALALGYKRVLRDRTDVYCREGCAYFEEIDRQIVTNDFSVHYLFGIKVEPWKLGILEFNIGGGLRMFKRESDPTIPDDAFISGFERGPLFSIQEDRWFLLPSILMSMQIGIGW